MLHVICFGNLWQGDDGFGIHVFRRLRERPGLPRQVKLFDAGIAGLGALGYFEGCRKAVIVDALKTGGRVGRVRRLRLDDLDPARPGTQPPCLRGRSSLDGPSGRVRRPGDARSRAHRGRDRRGPSVYRRAHATAAGRDRQGGSPGAARDERACTRLTRQCTPIPAWGPYRSRNSAPGFPREKTGVQMSHYSDRDIRSRGTTLNLDGL